MKLIAPALVAVFFVAACGDDTQADAAIAQIQLLNAQGFDPVNLDAQELALLASGCALAVAYNPEYAALCGPVLEAAK